MIKTTLLYTDLKNMLRDKSLWIIFFLPLLLIILLRFGMSQIENYFPIIFQYRPLILAFFSLLSSIMSGFLMAFLMLDEKDQQLLQVFGITPFNLSRLMIYRIALMIILGFIFSFSLILLSGMIKLNLPQTILISLACAISAPINTLLIVGLASNKIEGVSYFKLVNVITMLPLIGLFITGPIKYVFGIIPYFWIYLAIDKYNTVSSSICLLIPGLLLQVFYLLVVYRFFLRKLQA